MKERVMNLKKPFFSIVLILLATIIIILQAESNLRFNVDYFEYKTVHGDTCEKIAHTFNVSIASITKLNNLPAYCNGIKPDQILKIPFPSFTPGKSVSATRCPHIDCVTEIYTVRKDETLLDIAQKFQTTEYIIINYNGLTTDVYEGMKLVIPAVGCNPFTCK